MAVASLLCRSLMPLRRLAGLGSELEATRGGIQWHLDLTEGVDLAIYLFGRFESGTVRVFRRLLRPGSVVVDIGANSGANTLELARCVAPSGRVVAFEPTRYAVERLRRNLELNPTLSRVVTVEHAFLVDDDSREPMPEFYASWPLTGETTVDVHRDHRGQLKSAEGASRWTLDRYVKDKNIDSVRLIKLDVDGLEWSVLKGAGKTLARFQPFIVMELAPYVLDEREGSLEGIVELMREASYDFTDVSSGDKVPMSADGLRAKIPQGAGINVLARPMRGRGAGIPEAVSNELDAPRGEDHHLQE